MCTSTRYVYVNIFHQSWICHCLFRAMSNLSLWKCTRHMKSVTGHFGPKTLLHQDISALMVKCHQDTLELLLKCPDPRGLQLNTAAGGSPACYFCVLPKRSIPKPDQHRKDIIQQELAAWRSGNGVGPINEVTLRRARLSLGWVTCPDSTLGGGALFWYVTSHPSRLSLSSFRGR